MPHALPERIWPLRLSRRGERFDGSVVYRDLPRLVAAVVDVEGDVRVSLDFHGEDQGSTVRGRIVASLVLCCQRCLGPMQWQAEIDVATRFLSVDSKEDKSDLECVQLDDDGSTGLWALIEDEILLAMPQFPVHDEQECPVKLQADAPIDAEPRENPFAVLAKFKVGD